MSRILHLSDPHFGTERQGAIHALHKLAATQQPDLILLSGDITQRARRLQFAAARLFTDSLPAPVLSVPGNHDIPLFNLAARFIHPYRNYRRAFGDELEPEFETPDLLVVGVNTTRPSRHKDGEVSATQTARVAQRLAKASSKQLRIVVQHHPVRAKEESDLSNLLIGAQQAIPAWVDAGMDLLLAGHIHLPYVLPLYGKAGKDGRTGWTAQAGTALSNRIRGDVSNSINLISHTVQGAQHECVVERWDYSADRQAFLPADSTRLVLMR